MLLAGLIPKGFLSLIPGDVGDGGEPRGMCCVHLGTPEHLPRSDVAEPSGSPGTAAVGVSR